MTRKEIVLVMFAVFLAGVYLGCFTDWFKEKHIRVEHTVRPNVVVPSRSGAASQLAKPSAYTLIFSLGREYKLKSVKVVPAAEYQANPNVLPLWHLVGDAKSAPTRFIVYGLPLPGMKPMVAYADARPLEPGVEYRLIVEAGRTRGEHDFKIIGPAVRVGDGGNL
jgi:hypothetical protein